MFDSYIPLVLPLYIRKRMCQPNGVGISKLEAEKVRLARQLLLIYEQTKYRENAGTILKSIAGFLPDFNMQEGLQGICEQEYLDYIEKQLFSMDTVENSPLLFAQIEAIGLIPDYAWTMPKKAEILLRLFKTPATQFSRYKRDASVIARSPVVVQNHSVNEIYDAVAQVLVRSNLALNSLEYQRILLEEVSRMPAGTGYRAILHPNIDEVLSVRGNWQGYKDDGYQLAKDVLAHWIREINSILSVKVNNRDTFRSLIKTVVSIKNFGNRYELESEVNQLVDRIVNAKGNFKATENVYHGPERLLAAANGCEYLLE